MVELDPQSEHFDKRPQPIEELYPVNLGPRLEQIVHVSSTLPCELKEWLISLLRQNTDLFAWTPTDMLGIDPLVICHRLALDPKARLVAQRKRRLGEER